MSLILILTRTEPVLYKSFTYTFATYYSEWPREVDIDIIHI